MEKGGFWIIFLIVLLGTACSNGNSTDVFIGKWAEEGKDLSEPIEIKEEDDHLFLLWKNDNEIMEVPTIYDKEQRKLSAKLSNGGRSLDIHIVFLPDSKRLKINMMGKSAELFKLTNKEATERENKIAEYYNPNFFVGKWENTGNKGEELEIKKENNKYYLITEFSGKRPLAYKSRMFTHRVGTMTSRIFRLENGNIKWGLGSLTNEYKRVK